MGSEQNRFPQHERVSFSLPQSHASFYYSSPISFLNHLHLCFIDYLPLLEGFLGLDLRSQLHNLTPNLYIFYLGSLLMFFHCCFHSIKHISSSDLTSNHDNCISNLVYILGAIAFLYRLLVILASVSLREHYGRQTIPTPRNLVDHFKPARTELEPI